MDILIVQNDIIWGSPSKNLQKNSSTLESFLNNANPDKKPDIIVFPEMFSTGFITSCRDSVEKKSSGKYLSEKWMQDIAKKYDCAVCGSIAIEENNKCYNRFFFVTPDDIYHYDKRHLFSYGGEDHLYTAGSQKIIVKWRGWKFLLQTCYDLRFPTFSRNKYRCDSEKYLYDAIIYVANWPKSRVNAWDILLKARAIENQCYVIGVNRVGNVEDIRENRENKENQNDTVERKPEIYSGNSAIINFKGDAIAQCNSLGEEECIDCELDKNLLDNFREKFPSLKDAD